MQDNVEGGLLAKNYCIKVTCVVLFVIAPIITREDYAFFLAKWLKNSSLSLVIKPEDKDRMPSSF